MTQIRNATLADMPVIVSMSERFYRTLPFVDWFDFSPATVETLTANLVSDHVMLVAEVEGRVVGMVGLVVIPFIFNTEHRSAHEIVWWVDPEHQGNGTGKALLAAIEPACKEFGAEAIYMVHMANSPPQASALYERLGYEHIESSYAKPTAAQG